MRCLWVRSVRLTKRKVGEATKQHASTQSWSQRPLSLLISIINFSCWGLLSPQATRKLRLCALCLSPAFCLYWSHGTSSSHCPQNTQHIATSTSHRTITAAWSSSLYTIPAYCHQIIFSLHNPSILPPDHLLSTQPQHTATKSSSLYTTPTYCHQIISLHNPNILPPDHLFSRHTHHTATRSSSL